MKKFIKYTSRIVLGLLTIFLGFLAYVAYHPDESYHHCEAGQKDLSPVYGVIITFVSMILFCFVWHKTKNL